MLKEKDKIGYCLRCKKHQEIENATEDLVKTKGGLTKRVAKGLCSTCHCRMTKFLKKEEEE